ncbi:S26 family signal peptidase [Virgisporangium ochraceum]|uniref:signal peptidase I n=1 Tax=Virgisporangium ochraceum TaxID=65505 RepID=A0A8J3ZV43_9ACTN|nr:S26 family signal peptidase [Virgisporangium ochraceum]GIJ70499.1 S26 family signal peptidase [Virgisporangium ochraceum]
MLYAAVVVVAVAAVLLAIDGVRRRFAVVTVDGMSMAPTFTHGDRVLVRRVAPSALRLGQVVVLQQHADHQSWDTAPLPARAVGTSRWYIKRIAAAPGDPVPPSAVRGVGAPAGTPVPVGRLVVIGDNVGESTDSRFWGYAPVDRVLGVVVRRMG